MPLRVGSAEERVLAARLQAARALYNACLAEARTRWFLVKQSRAYQHARTLPRQTPERTDRVVWRGLSIPAYLLGHRTRADEVLAHGLAAPVKYVRLVRRRIGEKHRYCVQLICEGKPYQKPEHRWARAL